MKFEPTRVAAINKLSNFLEEGIKDYSRLRNFDFGPNKRSNISSLSPYITHGIVNELYIIENSLKKNSFVKIEKFIQEILWRIYWRGWLELRPVVYTNFLADLKKLKIDFKNNKNYLDAIE